MPSKQLHQRILNMMFYLRLLAAVCFSADCNF